MPQIYQPDPPRRKFLPDFLYLVATVVLLALGAASLMFLMTVVAVMVEKTQ